MSEVTNDTDRGFIPVKPISEPQTRVNIEGLGACREALGKIKKAVVKETEKKKSVPEINPSESEFAKWRRGRKNA